VIPKDWVPLTTVSSTHGGLHALVTLIHRLNVLSPFSILTADVNALTRAYCRREVLETLPGFGYPLKGNV